MSVSSRANRLLYFMIKTLFDTTFPVAKLMRKLTREHRLELRKKDIVPQLEELNAAGLITFEDDTVTILPNSETFKQFTENPVRAEGQDPNDFRPLYYTSITRKAIIHKYILYLDILLTIAERGRDKQFTYRELREEMEVSAVRSEEYNVLNVAWDRIKRSPILYFIDDCHHDRRYMVQDMPYLAAEIARVDDAIEYLVAH